MYELTVRRHFDASHIVEGHPGKCARLHGHRWVAELVVACEKVDAIGIGIDFGALKAACDEVLPDHAHINDRLPPGWPATAEKISEWLYATLRPMIAELGGRLRCVRIWESPDCAATYLPPEG
ncbi:MAG TPA: 6-carboxytetrahydropterin synthase [Limnochordia bacterium]